MTLGEKSFRCALVGVVLAAVFGAGAIWGQVTASISGKVADPSGAAVPGATVTVTSLETGATRTTTTDATGTYRVLSLAVGPYSVKAEAAGFKAAVQSGINLVVAQEAVVNLRLEVGVVQEQVTVTAEAPVVNTTTSSVSGLVGEREVKDLPLNGRSFDSLIALNPSAVNTSAFRSGGGTTVGAVFTVAGRRPLDNLILLNGIEYTGSGKNTNTPGGVSGKLLGIDAVREFNVVSDTYGAEYGKRAGGQVSVVTQSGTNQLHGSAFEFLRNSVLDARNFFDFPPGQRIPPFKRNQFGGSLGGPIKKDKMFLFGSYEGYRQRLGLSNVAFVPDNNARQGLLPIGPNNSLIQVPNLDPRILPLTALWPQVNGPVLGGGVAENFSNPGQAIREDFGTTRFDYNISEKNTFNASATVDDGQQRTPDASSIFGNLEPLRSEIISAQETHIFSPQLLNTIRAGFSRAALTITRPALIPLPAGLSFVQGRTPGAIVIGGTTGAAAGAALTNTGAATDDGSFVFKNIFTGSDDLQLIRGKHQFSFGGWVQRFRENSLQGSRQDGQAQFDSLLTFLQGTTSNFTAGPLVAVQYWRSTEGAWYVQDNMQLRPNLTLRVGLRDEFTNGWNERYGRAANYTTDASGVLQIPTRVGGSALTQNNATSLFSPRVGLAWDPFGKGKTSIRAGFGIYHTLLDNLSFRLGEVPPFNTIVTFQSVPLLSVVPLRAGFTEPDCAPGVSQPCITDTPTGVQSSAKTPTALEWNYTIEQQLTANVSLRVAYVGSHGYHNVVSVDPNTIAAQICSDPAGCLAGGITPKSPAQAALVPQGTQYVPLGTRPNPFLANGTFWYFAGVSFYNALQADVTRRFSSGLTFRANYTFSKNLDNGSGVASSQQENQTQQIMVSRDPLRDYGLSALDYRHQGGAHFTYELPFGSGKRFANGLTGASQKLISGWQVNGILTLLSGFAFTPQVGSNQSGDGNKNNPDRPNRNPNFQGTLMPRTVAEWYNPNAYSLPTLGTYGNVGHGVLEGPGLATFDFSIFKTTVIKENMKLEFRAELFNLFNRANFGLPNPTVFSSGQISASAGVITNTTTTSRQIEFGLKLMF